MKKWTNFVYYGTKVRSLVRFEIQNVSKRLKIVAVCTVHVPAQNIEHEQKKSKFPDHWSLSHYFYQRNHNWLFTKDWEYVMAPHSTENFFSFFFPWKVLVDMTGEEILAIFHLQLPCNSLSWNSARVSLLSNIAENPLKQDFWKLAKGWTHLLRTFLFPLLPLLFNWRYRLLDFTQQNGL